jgi:hypothetical protein
MTKLIATKLNDTETKALSDIKAAMIRNDGSDENLMGLLRGKAERFNTNTWEVMLTLGAKGAKLLADKAREGYGDDKDVEADVILPLTAFVESFASSPEAWLTRNPDGSPVTPEMAAGLLKLMRLLQENTRLRLELLGEVNQSLEKAVMKGDVKIVIDAKTSAYTKQPLKPLSKRDLTAQMARLVMFLTDNPEGFSIH